MEAGILFTDVDGTLAHYKEDVLLHGTLRASEAGGPEDVFHPEDEGHSSRLFALPISTSGRVAYISRGTIQLCRTLRRQGQRLVLISGMRLTTFMARLPYLPAADAYVIENGGRIFYEDLGRGTAAALQEDTAWRRTHTVAGPASQESLAPEERTGALWEAYRKMRERGLACDVAGYSTAVRVAPGGLSEAGMRGVLSTLPPSLTFSYNLGAADVIPATSGKERAMRYLAARWGVPPDHSRCVCMGDDDNDVAMANACGHCYVPGVNADSMRDAIAARSGRFTVARRAVFAATEECLQAVLDRFSDN